MLKELEDKDSPDGEGWKLVTPGNTTVPFSNLEFGVREQV